MGTVHRIGSGQSHPPPGGDHRLMAVLVGIISGAVVVIAFLGFLLLTRPAPQPPARQSLPTLPPVQPNPGLAPVAAPPPAPSPVPPSAPTAVGAPRAPNSATQSQNPPNTFGGSSLPTANGYSPATPGQPQQNQQGQSIEQRLLGVWKNDPTQSTYAYSGLDVSKGFDESWDIQSGGRLIVLFPASRPVEEQWSIEGGVFVVRVPATGAVFRYEFYLSSDGRVLNVTNRAKNGKLYTQVFRKNN